jgi:group I intron endonuclease
MWIYCITNPVNNKIYIGQHSGDLEKYLALNFRRASGKRQNDKPLLYRAIRKYGPVFSITGLVRPIDKAQADALERFFIRCLDARDPEIGYNLAEGGTGGNTSEGLKRSPETKEKIRLAHLGKPKSEEHKKKLSEAKTGKPAPAVSESNIRRRDKNPTKHALRCRRYRERLKQKGNLSNGAHPT